MGGKRVVVKKWSSYKYINSSDSPKYALIYDTKRNKREAAVPIAVVLVVLVANTRGFSLSETSTG